MENLNIVDEVIKSKCRGRHKCYLCHKGKAIPYIIPDRENIETIYRIAHSMEIFKMVKVFWLCGEHFDQVRKSEDNDFNSSIEGTIDYTIEHTYDLGFLDRCDQFFSSTIDANSKVRGYARIVRKSIDGTL